MSRPIPPPAELPYEAKDDIFRPSELTYSTISTATAAYYVPATKPLKIKKSKPPKAAQPPTEIKLPTVPVPEGVDPKYYGRVIGVLGPKKDQYYAQYMLQALSEEKPAGFIKLLKPCCSQCHTLVENNTLACPCISHLACGFMIMAANVIYKSRCGRPEHCVHCCHCIVCATCKKMIPANTKASPIKGSVKALKGYHINCKRCVACCKCQPCVTCGESVNKQCTCSSLNRPHHADCCDSNEMLSRVGAAIFFIKRQPIFHEGTEFQQVRTRRFLSTEIEVTNFTRASHLPTLNELAREWGAAVVKDGTIPAGAEFNTAPSSGNQFVKQQQAFAKHLLLAGANITERCGLHVHVDARDLYYIDLVNLIHLYDKIEVALFAMMPPNRRISRFANPCRHELMEIARSGNRITERVRDLEMARHHKALSKQRVKKYTVATKLAQTFYGSESLMHHKNVHKDHNNQRLRYMALNLHSWVYRRTLEFRHWPGTINEQELVCWPQIVSTIVDTAKSMPLTLIKKLPEHPVKALMQILEPSSKVSPALCAFARSKIEQWSPDFELIWPLIQASDHSAVHPFKQASHDGMVLAFDLSTMNYSYIPKNYKNWEYEWKPPQAVRGRYAEKLDLVALPSGSVNWIHPNPPKVEVAATPTPTNVIGERPSFVLEGRRYFYNGSNRFSSPGSSKRLKEQQGWPMRILRSSPHYMDLMSGAQHDLALLSIDGLIGRSHYLIVTNEDGEIEYLYK